MHLSGRKIKMNLFQLGDFTLHSGNKSFWKIECDALTDNDWKTLAAIVADRFHFSSVVGIPKGGKKLAWALEEYTCHEPNCPLLIVDDVLTTGISFEDFLRQLIRDGVNVSSISGLVVFARGKCPSWVTPIFQLWG